MAAMAIPAMAPVANPDDEASGTGDGDVVGKPVEDVVVDVC